MITGLEHGNVGVHVNSTRFDNHILRRDDTRTYYMLFNNYYVLVELQLHILPWFTCICGTPSLSASGPMTYLLYDTLAMFPGTWALIGEGSL